VLIISTLPLNFIRVGFAGPKFTFWMKIFQQEKDFPTALHFFRGGGGLLLLLPGHDATESPEAFSFV